MSTRVRTARTRWPLAALLAGSVLALILSLVPARADALAEDGYCSATGFFLCYRPEIGFNSSGTLEVRMFFNEKSWGPVAWEF
jgi:hypothetical protein